MTGIGKRLPSLAYEDLLKEFEGMPPYDSLVKFVTGFDDLRKKYLVEDLMDFMRKLKGELRDEDLYRFYEEYPDLKLDFVSIASLLIGWIPPPPVESGEMAPITSLDKMRRELKERFERLLLIERSKKG